MTESTLTKRSKKELIDLILMYQKNEQNLQNTIDQQYINFTKIIDDINKSHKNYLKSRNGVQSGLMELERSGEE